MIFERTQELVLELRLSLTAVVEKHSDAVGEIQDSLSPGVRIGERAILVAIASPLGGSSFDPRTGRKLRGVDPQVSLADCVCQLIE